MFNSLPTIRWSVSPKRDSRSKYQSSAMMSHYDIENTDLGQRDDYDGARTNMKLHIEAEQAVPDHIQGTSDSQGPVALQRSVSFPEWIIGRWSSAFNSISSADPAGKESDASAHDESTALLSHSDELLYGTNKSSKNTPTLPIAAKGKLIHPLSGEHANNNSMATTELDRSLLVHTQPKKDLPQYESFKDLTPRVGRYGPPVTTAATIVTI